MEKNNLSYPMAFIVGEDDYTLPQSISNTVHEMNSGGEYRSLLASCTVLTLIWGPRRDTSLLTNEAEPQICAFATHYLYPRDLTVSIANIFVDCWICGTSRPPTFEIHHPSYPLIAMEQINLRIETPAPHDFEAPIQTIIHAAIQPTNASSAKDAALALDAVYLDYIKDPNMDPGGVLTCFWELINSFASQIPYEHPAQEKLVAIVQELAGVTSTETIHNEQLWRNLPYFTSEFPQTWEGGFFSYCFPIMLESYRS